MGFESLPTTEPYVDRRVCSLTKRELDLLHLAANGLTDRMIAQQLGLTRSTVESYWNRMRLKLAASSRTEAVAIFAEWEAGRLKEIQQELADELKRKSLDHEVLRAANLELEARVRERTAELEAANALLRKELAERRQAEAAFRLSEAQCRTVIEAAPDLIWLKSPDGRYIGCNHAFEVYLGKPKSEIVGKHSDTLLPPNLQAKAAEYDRLTMLSGARTCYETRMRFANGYEGDFELVRVPVRDSAGDLLGVAGIAREVTERRRLETKLRSERDFMRGVVRRMPGYLAVVDADGRTITANDGLLRACGRRRAEVVGRRFVDAFVAAEARQSVSGRFEEPVAPGNGIVVKARLFVPGGSGPEVEWHGLHGRSRDGRGYTMWTVASEANGG